MAPSHFDDVFIHSKAMDGKSDVEMHRIHLRALLQTMRENKLYANLKKNHAHVTHALTQHLMKDKQWDWSLKCQESILTLKKNLVEAPILAIADMDKTFHIVCDASDFAIGTALMQINGCG